MKRIFLCVIPFLSCFVSTAQKHEIFVSDSQYLKSGGYDFVDTLPDGEWTMYDVIKKKKIIIATGNYKNSLREGAFKHYGISKDRFPVTTYNYKQGKLHGPYEVRYDKYRLEEQGMYLQGKRQGYFIRWTIPGFYYIKWIENYHNDTLYDCVGYYDNSATVQVKSSRKTYNDTSEIIYYDSNSFVQQRILITENRIIKVVNFYPNGGIENEIIGEYFGYRDGRFVLNNPDIDYYEHYSFRGGPINFPPYSGKQINYGIDGNLINIEYYKDGKKKQNDF